MHKSKIMKNLLAQLEAKRAEAVALQNKADATIDEIKAKTEEIKAIKAKISAQEAIDEGKEFDENGDEIQNTAPVNQPVFANPRNPQAGPFRSFGDQMLAIVRSSGRGAAIDNRLLAIQNAAGANEAIPSEGGFLVQQDFSNEIVKTMFDTGLIMSRCRAIEIGANSNGIKLNGIDETSRADGSRWGGVQAYWVNEAATATATKPKFRKIELGLNKLMGLYYATDELLQDSTAMDSILSQAFGEELAFKGDDAVFRGDGAGKPLGILNSGALVEQAKEGSQTAATVVHANISKMWTRLTPRSRANAVWLINQEIEPQLEAMTITTGVLSPLAIEYMTKGTLKGRPVIAVEQASALGTAGDIVLADLGQYLLAKKGGVQVASSMHVQFLYDEMAFRVTYRVDGQPVIASPITPYKGSATISPFVSLATRS